MDSADLQNALKDAANIISSSQNFLLTCHVHPDGDALGSTVAMAHALKVIGKSVKATFSDPFVIPESLQQTLPGVNELVVPLSEICVGDMQGRFDAIITFDCGSKSRMGEVINLFDTVKNVINIDHHVSNEGFGTINVIDTNAASSGSVVLDLLDELSIGLNSDIAQCLYVALLTDTGRFQFYSTTPKVFEQAKRYSQFDLPIAYLSRKLTEESSFAFLQLAGQALSEMVFDHQSHLVSAVATIEMQERYGVKYDELEGLIEFVRRAKESDITCVLKEFEPQDYRVSLRSLGKIDVCEIANSFGGGGHRFAAGFSATEAPIDIVSAVTREVLKQRNKA